MFYPIGDSIQIRLWVKGQEIQRDFGHNHAVVTSRKAASQGWTIV
jgi:hypothetical protein